MKRAIEQMAAAAAALLAASGKLASHTNRSKVRTTMAGLMSLAAIGPLAAPAFAASGPQVTIACTGPNSCTATGSGFTPSGRVQAQAYAGSSDFSSANLVASAPTLFCATGAVKPVCREFDGGGFTTALPVDYGLPCNATAAGSVQYKDVSSGAAVNQPVTWTGPCTAQTTTTLMLPSIVDTGWTPGVNPARVTAGSTVVTSGTITITVNGSSFCQYSAGANSGCTSAHLPAGTDQVQASYAGSTIPPYYPSSASATVTVLQVDPSNSIVTSPNWAGYVDTGDTFTAVSASWYVPKANCGFLETSTSATWSE